MIDDHWLECILQAVPEFVLQITLLITSPFKLDLSRYVQLGSSFATIVVCCARNQGRIASYGSPKHSWITRRNRIILGFIGIPRLLSWSVIGAYLKWITIPIFFCSVIYTVCLTSWVSLTTRIRNCNIPRLMELFIGNNYFAYSGSTIPVKQTFPLHGRSGTERRHWPYMLLSPMPLYLTLASIALAIHFQSIDVSPFDSPPVFHCFTNESLQDTSKPCPVDFGFHMLVFNNTVCIDDPVGIPHPVLLCDENNLEWTVPVVLVALMFVTSFLGFFLDFCQCDNEEREDTLREMKEIKHDVEEGANLVV